MTSVLTWLANALWLVKNVLVRALALPVSVIVLELLRLRLLRFLSMRHSLLRLTLSSSVLTWLVNVLWLVKNVLALPVFELRVMLLRLSLQRLKLLIVCQWWTVKNGTSKSTIVQARNSLLLFPRLLQIFCKTVTQRTWYLHCNKEHQLIRRTHGFKSRGREDTESEEYSHGTTVEEISQNSLARPAGWR